MLDGCSPGAVPPPGVVLFAVILQLPLHPPMQAAKQLPLQSFLQPVVHPLKQVVLQEPVQVPCYFLSFTTASITSMYF